MFSHVFVCKWGNTFCFVHSFSLLPNNLIKKKTELRTLNTWEIQSELFLFFFTQCWIRSNPFPIQYHLGFFLFLFSLAFKFYLKCLHCKYRKWWARITKSTHYDYDFEIDILSDKYIYRYWLLYICVYGDQNLNWIHRSFGKWKPK